MINISAMQAASGFATVLVALAPALLPATARAEPAAPGDIVVERNIGPEYVGRGLPRVENPIAVSVPAFPMGPFSSAMGAVNQVTDNELTGRGSAGLISGSVQAGINPVMGVLVGNASGGSALNASSVGGAVGGGAGVVGSIGTLVPSVINSALAPLMSLGAAGAAK
ncbi:hypothetical protein ACPWR0_12805 [Pandoraea pneumonica]|uniref:hypothetical protein n=1 Tax=Pandoraea pneumonica TaxID=2508299 RepID=UPI003CF7D8F7